MGRLLCVVVAGVVAGFVGVSTAWADPPPPEAFTCSMSEGLPYIYSGNLLIAPTVQCTGGSGGGYMVQATIYWKDGAHGWTAPAENKSGGSISIKTMPANSCDPSPDHYANGAQKDLVWIAEYSAVDTLKTCAEIGDTKDEDEYSRAVYYDPWGGVAYGTLCSYDIKETFTFTDAGNSNNQVQIGSNPLDSTC